MDAGAGGAVPAGVGILGGCFNPVHNGHLRLAIEVREQLGLARVELMPAHVPPHKPGEGMLPFVLRAALAEAAVTGVPGLMVSRLEAARPGPSYTVDTLTALRAAWPGVPLWFILGAGDLAGLPGWHRGLEIPALCNLAVAGRGGAGPEAVAAFVAAHWPGAGPDGAGGWRLPGGNCLRPVALQRLDISASDVRARWLAGRCLAGLVPREVECALDAGANAVRAAWT